MALKRRKGVNEKGKISGTIFVLLMLSCISVFIVFTITHVLIYSNIVSNNLSHYNGNFQFSIIRHRNNAEYLFVLDNGDRVTVKPELMHYFESNDLPPKLFFSYSPNKDVMQSSHTCVEIRDDNAVYLSIDASLLESKYCIILGVVMIALMVALLVLFFLASRPGRRKGHRQAKSTD